MISLSRTGAFVWLICVAQTIEKFDDSVLYRISFDGDLAPELREKYEEGNTVTDDGVVIRTADNEQYACSLPEADGSADKAPPQYTGSSPLQLMTIYHRGKTCTYRAEMYWAYELCHGRHIRQYHEEKLPNSKVKLQEYYLGQYLSDVHVEFDKNFDFMNPPTKKIEDHVLPYYPVRYVQGTLCDISNTPRITTVLYMCIPDTREFIHSVDEVSSCEYEVVFFTTLLCKHPSFRPVEPTVNDISCHPLHSAPKQPFSLKKWKTEEARHENSGYKNVIVGIHDKYGPIDLNTKGATPASVPATGSASQGAKQEPEPPPIVVDKNLADSFLSGEYCLYGGSGWWKHEYCHGRQVIQFHEDPKSGKRTEILLGIWSEDGHLSWLKRNPAKRPQTVGNRVTQITYFYSNGDFCDLSGVERQTEVRLKCRNASGSPNAVTLYLMEPKPCEYILVVESQMFCDVLQTVDADGLFPLS